MKKAIILIAILIISLPLITYAQPDPPGGPVPVDGAIGLLALAGAAYGAYKHRKN
ncbi:MAG: PID-CTERM protein-sorting domain-containing protein [Thermaurantimonas sp.]|uniref:PID-CTERM protein-sorting domain-containing protein n=1 Tax=Thermaurantimonas sp. TaxID=2681568 RepID=UPI003919DE82